MPSHGVVRRDRKNHSNLRPKHKHTKHYLKHYWPYLPMVTLVIVGLWILKPMITQNSQKSVLAVATNVNTNDLLEATNEQRIAHDKATLRHSPQLAAAAQAKAQDMVNKDYWSHNTPEGSPPWTFIIDSGYQYQKAGENLAHGFNSSNETVVGWMNSASHRQNLLDDNYMDVGFGIVSSGNYVKRGPSTIIVAMYGRSVTEAPVVSLASAGQPQTKTYNTEQAFPSAITQQNVSRVDVLTGTNYPWITPVLTFIIGAALAAYIVKHSIGVKKAMRRGEAFVITHPVLDTILVGVILGGLLITRQIGVIL